MSDTEEVVLSGEEMAGEIATKVDELAEEIAEALSETRGNYDYAEAAIAVGMLSVLQRLRHFIYERQ